jgi:hypothetical protein
LNSTVYNNWSFEQPSACPKEAFSRIYTIDTVQFGLLYIFRQNSNF